MFNYNSAWTNAIKNIWCDWVSFGTFLQLPGNIFLILYTIVFASFILIVL